MGCSSATIVPVLVVVAVAVVVSLGKEAKGVEFGKAPTEVRATTP